MGIKAYIAHHKGSTDGCLVKVQQKNMTPWL